MEENVFRITIERILIIILLPFIIGLFVSFFSDVEWWVTAILMLTGFFIAINIIFYLKLYDKMNNLMSNSHNIDISQNNTKIGLERIIDKKEEALKEKPIFLKKARKGIWILGVSLKSIFPKNKVFIEYLIDRVKVGVPVVILLLDPKSGNVKERAKTENRSENKLKNEIERSIKNIKKISEKNGIKNLELYLYDDYPAWHIILVDDKYAKVSYYPKMHVAEKAPYFVFNNRGEYNFIESFEIYIEQLKKKSKKEPI